MKILIVAEQQNGNLRKASLHAIAAGQDLAQRIGGELHVAVLGSHLASAIDELKCFQCHSLHAVESPDLKNYLAETYTQAITQLAKSIQIDWIGAAATAQGKDYMPRVATQMNAGMASEVTKFEGQGAAVELQRPMWAGNVLALTEILTPIKAFTIRATEFPLPAPGAPAHLEKEGFALPAPAKTQFLEFQSVQSTRPELTEARVVVSGGRGAKGNFQPIEALADKLGGAVGASRAAVDAGWVANDLQIGQTGKVVAPELYIAAGISGAIQHLAGMKGSKVIVAINTNPEAPIFQVADYGLVGDMAKVLPELHAAIGDE